jgi:hypothetical protein
MSKLLTALDDGVATVTLNHPESLNALGVDMAEELRETLQRVAGDARAIVLTGAGRGFSSGANLTAWPQRLQAWWRLTALIVLAYALGIVWFTRGVNLPLNQLTESWTSTTLPADWSVVRDAWNRANLWRAALSASLFALGLLSLCMRLQASTTPRNTR